MKSKLNFSDRAGFTLVELIVVIAILAILGGVAVPAYSAYVEKANEAADRQLISDVEQALILGAYANSYTPNTIVGAVGISAEGSATAEGDAADMMIKAFGESWQSGMNLKSDAFKTSDSAKLIEAIQNAKDPNTGTSIFDSVPVSSFYAAEGSTDELVADVDEIAGALNKVLNGIGKSSFANFWGQGFHETVDTAGLTSTWQENNQAASNLTVFAAANGITIADDKKKDAWIADWSSGGLSTVSVTNGYVTDLVMNYAQCVALNNYIKNTYPEEYQEDFIYETYDDLEKAMQNMNQNDPNSYVTAFNSALNDFWDANSEYAKEWQAAPEGGKSQSQIDAEAFMASMSAVNTMKDNYVNTQQVDLLKSKNAFEKAGAADVLDTMVMYSKMDTLPSGDYVIVLAIDANGMPVITPTLVED